MDIVAYSVVSPSAYAIRIRTCDQFSRLLLLVLIGKSDEKSTTADSGIYFLPTTGDIKRYHRLRTVINLYCLQVMRPQNLFSFRLCSNFNGISQFANDVKL